MTLRIANDYAAVIEGQRAGNIQIGYYGPASFSRARLTGVKTDAFIIDVNSDGTKGYYSVFYVRANSPYKTIEDLKGKNLGLVDPNSTSGYNMPMYTLDKHDISAETFFNKVLVTGSHENAVISLAQGTVDVCANWWNADDDSNLTRMLSKGMVKGRRRQAAEEGRFPHHPEVGPDHQFADRDADLAAGRSQGRHPDGVPGRGEERQGRVRPAFRRQEPALAADRQRRLQRHDQADPVRRRAAQEERLIAADRRAPALRGPRAARPAMDHTVIIPPDAQLEPLLRAYRAAVAAKRRQFLIGLAVMAAAFALACVGAEVDPALFWEKLGNFTSYFDRLAHLDSGARRAGAIPPNGSGACGAGRGCCATRC